MKIKHLRIGIVGAGAMLKYHTAGFRSAGGEVVALMAAHRESAESAARAFGIPRVCDSLDEMLALPDLNAVSIIAPNRFHAPMTLAALKAGKHVFCEKPPAINARDAAKMAAAAARAGRLLMFNFCNRARPESIALKRAIDAGTVGHINSAQAWWIRRAGIPGYGGWFTTRSLSGGGPVIDLLHAADLALHFMGFPEADWVLARTFDDFIHDPRFRGPHPSPVHPDGICDVEAAAHALVTFKDGSVISLRTSWAEMNRKQEVSVTFQGTKAGGRMCRTFELDGIDRTSKDTAELYLTDAKGRNRDRVLKIKPDPHQGRLAMAANFVRAVQGKAQPLSRPEEAVALMRIVDALYKSARTGRPIRVRGR